VSFGLGGAEDWTASRVAIQAEAMELDVACAGRAVATLRTSLVGEHNARNLLAAVAACDAVGIPPERFAEVVPGFEGVKRRQEVRGEVRGVLVLDDFAHHPTAVAVTLRSIRARYPGRPLWVVFEPRSATSRRAVFQDDYARCFDDADRVVIGALFAPEKISPDLRLDLDRLADDLKRRGRAVDRPGDTDAILDALVRGVPRGAVVVFMSSGGFANLPARLVERLREA
jgi:UDP-N-acetylmuramate: L-alanyl-gamma-D-glutamyl-meso-diaminopimelate ligase